MEKSKGKRLAERRQIQPEDIIDWSILSYEYSVTSDEDGFKEPTSRWIYKKKKKRLPIEKADQQIIKDLVINNEKYVLEKQPKEYGDGKMLLIKEAFKNIKDSVIYGIIKC